MKGLMQNSPLLVSQIIEYAAKWHGNQEIVSKTVEGGVIVSNYGELHRRALLCSAVLNNLGVKRGTIVATLAWNTARHLESWYGIMGMGAVCHTLNPRLSEQDLEYIINDAEDFILLADTTFVNIIENIAPKCKSLKAIILLTDSQHFRSSPSKIGACPVLCYERLLDESAMATAPATQLWHGVQEDDACGLCYTSGTTGKPKGVLYTHRSNYLHALALALPDAMSLGSGSVIMPVVPMFHANSWGLVFAAPMVGAALVLPAQQLDPPSIHHLMDTYKVTFTAGVPTVWLALLTHLEAHPALSLKHLKVLGIGGSAAPRSLVQAYQCRYGVEVRHIWGMTELSPVATLGSLKGAFTDAEQQDMLDIKVKQGRPHVLVDARIVDDQGQPLPHDGVAMGHLQVRGPVVLKQYFKVAAPPSSDAEGWFSSGDVASIDEHGHIRLTDRSKDVIKSGGEWISSIALEDVAMSHPAVLEAAVVAIIDDKWGERPLVVVALKSGHTGSPSLQADILASYKGRVARYCEPSDLVFVAEIPHNATGKVSKLTLRAMFRDYRVAQSKM